ncbi:hypothetical protein EON80_25955 [bacterium]|nr:MAG: hypothetical protein EON80_25955 [bacterium]
MNYEALRFEHLLNLTDDKYSVCVHAMLFRSDDETFAQFRSAFKRGAIKRKSACDALGQLRAHGSPHQKQITNLLLEHISGEKDEPILCSIIAALGQGEREARILNAILSNAEHPSPTVRWRVVCELGKYRDPTAVEALILRTQDEDEGVRQGTNYELASLNVDSPAIREAFMIGLSDEEPIVREAALYGLARLGDERVVPALLREFDADGNSKIFHAEQNPPEDTFMLALRKMADEEFTGDSAELKTAIARCEAYVNR